MTLYPDVIYNVFRRKQPPLLNIQFVDYDGNTLVFKRLRRDEEWEEIDVSAAEVVRVEEVKPR